MQAYFRVTYDVIGSYGSVKFGRQTVCILDKKSVILLIINAQTVFKLLFYYSQGLSRLHWEKVLNGFVYTLSDSTIMQC